MSKRVPKTVEITGNTSFDIFNRFVGTVQTVFEYDDVNEEVKLCIPAEDLSPFSWWNKEEYEVIEWNE